MKCNFFIYKMTLLSYLITYDFIWELSQLYTGPLNMVNFFWGEHLIEFRCHCIHARHLWSPEQWLGTTALDININLKATPSSKIYFDPSFDTFAILLRTVQF